MPDLCTECERLWREYSAAVRESLGLNGRACAGCGMQLPKLIRPERGRGVTISELKKRILEHENAAHSSGT